MCGGFAAWPATVAAYIEVLIELDRYEDAKAVGERALVTCRELEIEVGAYDIARALSLALGKRLDYAGAAMRLEAVIEGQRRLGVTGLNLGASYEARARVAIWAGDSAAVEFYSGLTAREYRHGRGSPLGARYERLAREASGAGMRAPELSEFESTLLVSTAHRVA